MRWRAICADGGVLAILIALSYHHTYRSGGVCDGDATLQRLSSSLFRTSFALYFGGLALWITDNVACSSVRPFHFHSLWHLGAGACLQLSFVTVALTDARLRRLRHVCVDIVHHRAA